MLETEGFKVLEACHGKEALEVVTYYQGHLDLLVTDVNMPQMDGLDLAENIKVVRPGIKILVMSGKDSGALRAASLKLPFLEKPFNLKGFMDAVRRALAG
jgi:DNA-binding NtrC family response regulator